jgi:predicted nucleotidyltransferase
MTAFTPAQIEALRGVRAAFPDAQIAIIGAAALAIHIPMKWRITADLDVVLAVSFDDLESIPLMLPGWTQHPKQEQRWRAPSGAVLDIVAVPPGALARRLVVWPRSGHQMSLAGVQQALDATPTTLAPGLSMVVAPVPVIVMLKMAAYADRPGEREKDLKDIAHVLDEYPLPSDDRLFADDILDLGLDERRARPFILGREIAALADDDDRAMVLRFFELMAEDQPGWARMLGSSPWRFDEDQLALRVAALRDAFMQGA